MFWGLIMEPNKRYTQVVEKPFHISQAAMDISTGDGEACQVMIVVDGKNFLLCTLQKNKTIQVPLDLYFKSGDAISFLTNGKCNVHLTGYLDPEFEEQEEDEDDSEDEEEEEVSSQLVTKAKRKLENSNDSKSKKRKITNDDSSDSDEDGDKLENILNDEDIETDENDDSFKVNISTEGDDSDDDDSDEDDEEEEEEENDEDNEKTESSGEADTTLDTSKEEGNLDMSKLSKSQRRRLKKKLQQQGKAPQVNGVEKPKKEKQAEQQKGEKKKQQAKKDSKEDKTAAKKDLKEDKTAAKKDSEDKTADKKEKKTLSGGVMIEDLKVGTGPVAKPGKVVLVYYEGRMKQNNKMFDNCQKGPGFKFRLGSKEVISGWDVGVAGMKVGGKRKIICPPAMAYGAKGSPPVIPPNSTLVFEVELKQVK